MSKFRLDYDYINQFKEKYEINISYLLDGKYDYNVDIILSQMPLEGFIKIKEGVSLGAVDKVINVMIDTDNVDSFNTYRYFVETFFIIIRNAFENYVFNTTKLNSKISDFIDFKKDKDSLCSFMSECLSSDIFLGEIEDLQSLVNELSQEPYTGEDIDFLRYFEFQKELLSQFENFHFSEHLDSECMSEVKVFLIFKVLKAFGIIIDNSVMVNMSMTCYTKGNVYDVTLV